MERDADGGGDDPAEQGLARRRRAAVVIGVLSGPLAVLFVLFTTFAAGSGPPRTSSPPAAVSDEPLDLSDVAALLGAASDPQASPTTAPPPGDYSSLCRVLDPEVVAWGGVPGIADLVHLLERADLARWAVAAPPGLRPTLVDLQRAVIVARPILQDVAATGAITAAQLRALPSGFVSATTRVIQVWMARCAGG